MIDASDKEVRAVIQQHIGDYWQSISYFSKKLKPSETKYGTFDRELLAVDLSIKFFHISTDHKPLTYSLSSHSNHYTPVKPATLTIFLSSRQTSDMLKDPTTHLLTHSHEWDLMPYFKKTHLLFILNRLATAQRQDPGILKLQTSSSSLILKACPIPALMVKSFVICLPVYLTQLFYHHSEDKFLISYTHSHILELEPLSGSSLLVLPGQTTTLMYRNGPDPVFSVNDLKYTIISTFATSDN